MRGSERPAVFDDTQERDLMARIAKGDGRAFEELYRIYAKAVGNFLFRMCYDTGMAEDCLQDVFLRLWKAAPSWRGEGKVSTFIFQIAKNLGLDAREKAQRARAHGFGGSGNEDGNAQLGGRAEEPASQEPGPAQRLAGEELREAVRRAVESLPVEQRLVVQLALTEELTYREVAEILQLPLGTVKSRMAAAAESLRKKLRVYVKE